MVNNKDLIKLLWASLVAQRVKRLAATWETWVRSVGRESPGEGNGNYSSILAWRIPWTEEPGGLQSTGLQRVWHNWATFTFFLASLVVQLVKSLPARWETRIRSLVQEDSLEQEMATTPVFLPGESHGQRILVYYSARDHKELDMTGWLTQRLILPLPFRPTISTAPMNISSWIPTTNTISICPNQTSSS